MPNEQQPDNIDWQLTTWEGSRREQLLHWAALPLEDMIQAIEDMAEFVESFPPTNKTVAAHEEPAKDRIKVKFDE